MSDQKKIFDVFSAGLITENPVLRLVLGTCPTLAVTTSGINGLSMGLATMVVLMGSNLVISMVRNVIPDKVRIPAFIVIISGFVTIIQLLIKAFAPAIDQALGIFIPLIVVNCIILGRAEMFAAKNPPLASLMDGVGMGLGFTGALFIIGLVRELLGAGTLLGFSLTDKLWDPMSLMILAPGGFLIFGFLIALLNRFSSVKIRKLGCETCGDQGCTPEHHHGGVK